MSERLEMYQEKQARLNYILNLLQVFALTKKNFDLQAKIEEEIKRLAEVEVGTPAEVK